MVFVVPSIAQMEISPYKDTIPPPERAVGAAPPALLRANPGHTEGAWAFQPMPRRTAPAFLQLPIPAGDGNSCNSQKIP